MIFYQEECKWEEWAMESNNNLCTVQRWSIVIFLRPCIIFWAKVTKCAIDQWVKENELDMTLKMLHTTFWSSLNITRLKKHNLIMNFSNCSKKFYYFQIFQISSKSRQKFFIARLTRECIWDYIILNKCKKLFFQTHYDANGMFLET